MVLGCDFYTLVRLYGETAAKTRKWAAWIFVPPTAKPACAAPVLSRDRHHRLYAAYRLHSHISCNHRSHRIVLASARKLSGR